MSDINKNSIIVIAEDDEDDYLLTMEALKEAGITEHQVKWVKDGEELMDFLNENIDSKSSSDCPSPGMILLDLNMPKKDGREALSEIKSNPNLRRIPVIVLTTSKAEGDIFHSYDLGVNSFIQKPVRFKQFVD
ncbi:MAG: response regulator, partial [Nitrospinales bacterium]